MKTAQLLYSDSEHGADMLYATGVKVPDPFIWLKLHRQTFVIVGKLEFDRVKREAKVDQVLPSESFYSPKAKRKGTEVILANLSQKLGFQAVEVPSDFPLGLAEALRKQGLLVRVKKGSFFPQRQIKTAEEIEKIRQAQGLAELGLARGLEVLHQARIRKDHSLQWSGQPLTSERLRGEIDAAVIREGGLPAGTIVAGGDQACDPHERGHGPLWAGQTIIIDIFPRHQRTGYFGDLTRTLVKGTASEAQHRLYQTVQEGQSWVLGQVKEGVDGAKLHDQLTARFTQAGFPTEQKNGRWGGFFHGTGHSLGLEIHEAPRFSAGKFRAGTIMTIEPGLYYSGLGGVRLEDLVVVRPSGSENLTTAPFHLEIR